ncbi:TPA_asm: hypothetical protein [Metorhabdovirus 2]|nr:TPA_asm: hypothetical protein [Metorhabdovirus 2]
MTVIRDNRNDGKPMSGEEADRREFIQDIVTTLQTGPVGIWVAVLSAAMILSVLAFILWKTGLFGLCKASTKELTARVNEKAEKHKARARSARL